MHKNKTVIISLLMIMMSQVTLYAAKGAKKQ